MLPAILSERLRQLRADLSLCLNESWSDERLAHAAQVPVSTLTAFEREGTGSADDFAALLLFYQEQGYNLQWLLVPDNTALPLYTLGLGWESVNAPWALEEMRKIQQVVQRRIHRVLEHLLPPGGGLSDADRRYYQQLLPPVRAAVSGWQSRGVDPLPCHYYTSGDTLPRCGDETAYLAYDEVLPAAFGATQCSHCAATL